jgi:hypothetical protein
VVAVVDRETERGLEVGPAASARMPGKLVHNDPTILRNELYRCRQTGKAGADNVRRTAGH